MSKPTLQDYIETGFTPEQINIMYNNLLETQSLIYNLICGDRDIVEQAVDDAMIWLDSFIGYSKEGLH
jgi:hypothetical protein